MKRQFAYDGYRDPNDPWRYWWEGYPTKQAFQAAKHGTETTVTAEYKPSRTFLRTERRQTNGVSY